MSKPLRDFRQHAAHYGEYLLVRVLICVFQSLSLDACQKLSRQLGWFCCRVLKLRGKVVAANLQIAFPEKTPAERDSIALGMWQHLLLMVMEIAHAPRKVKRTTWRRYSPPGDVQKILDRLVDDRPLVIISGHHGNFELGGYLLALQGFPTHTVARTLDNPYLHEFVNQFRESTGQYMLPKQGSGPQIAEVLDRNGTLVLLGDQFAGQKGCWVDFFGKLTSTHKAVSVFTLGSDAPTAVLAAPRHHGKPLSLSMMVADVVDPLDSDFDCRTIPQLTQWYTSHLEALIRRAPEQYWWLHRRWKGEPVNRQALRERKRAA